MRDTPGDRPRVRLGPVEALASLPGIAIVFYSLGGVTLAVQAKQAGLPWLSVLDATSAKSLLARGVLPVLLGALLVPIMLVLLAAAQRTDDWWKRARERRLNRAAARLLNLGLSAAWIGLG